MGLRGASMDIDGITSAVGQLFGEFASVLFSLSPGNALGVVALVISLLLSAFVLGALRQVNAQNASNARLAADIRDDVRWVKDQVALATGQKTPAHGPSQLAVRASERHMEAPEYNFESQKRWDHATSAGSHTFNSIQTFDGKGAPKDSQNDQND